MSPYLGVQMPDTRLDLRKLRDGRSRREVCASLGVTERTLARWEDGEVRPGGDNLLRLARFYGVPAERLLADPGASA